MFGSCLPSLFIFSKASVLDINTSLLGKLRIRHHNPDQLGGEETAFSLMRMLVELYLVNGCMDCRVWKIL